MNVCDAIKTRRSIRKYKSQPVEKDKLNAVLEAARLAPSARNTQSWKFIAVTDKKVIEKLKQACCNQGFVGEAPVVIVACATRRHIMTCGQPSDIIDLSIATSFMLLEACEQGLGTCWLGAFHADKVKEALNIPDDIEVVAVTPLGYPDEQPAARPRKALCDIVSYDRY
jgi:nitroreductase